MKALKIIGVMVASVFALAIFFSPAQAELTIAGDLEINTDYATNSTDNGADLTIYDMSGRVKVSPTARAEAGNLYMEATGQILANVDGSAAIDDVWGKIGTSKFDIQIGRYEGYSLFDKGQDVLIVDAPTGVGRYEANTARGRMGTPGQLALHILPSDAFNIELGLVYGQDDDTLEIDTSAATTPGASDVNYTGVRPVIVAKFGPVELGVGAEMLTIAPQDGDEEGEISHVGFGAKVKATFGIATVGVNLASGTKTTTNYDVNPAVLDTVEQPDETTQSIGAYCDLALGKGTLSLAGFVTNYEVDDVDATQTHNQYFLCYIHPLPIDGAAIKFAVSQATAENDDVTADSDAFGFRVRINYAF